MNSFLKNQCRGTILFTAIIIFLSTLLPAKADTPVLRIYSWQKNIEQVEKQYISGQKLKRNVVPVSKLGYTHKILNYILAINADLKEKVTIHRVESAFSRDFLFVNDILYSVSDRHNRISNKSIQSLLGSLKRYYGTPRVQHDRDVIINTYSKDNTKVIFIIETSKQGKKATVYYYAKNLFQSLMKK